MSALSVNLLLLFRHWDINSLNFFQILDLGGLVHLNIKADSVFTLSATDRIFFEYTKKIQKVKQNKLRKYKH